MRTPIALLLCCLALCSVACGSPAVPFDTLKTSNVTVYRLQNWEPPAAAPGSPPGAMAPGAIPGLPPEIQALAQQAVPALQQLIPPGLLPPGLIPGLPAAPAAAPEAQAPRFHGFRILEQQPVMDSDLKEQLGEMLGSEDSFQPQHANCLYSELGLSFSSNPGAPPNDVLISFSCNQMQGHNFMWPHKSTGMTSDTVQELAEIVGKLFPPQAGPPPAPMAHAKRIPIVRL